MRYVYTFLLSQLVSQALRGRASHNILHLRVEYAVDNVHRVSGDIGGRVVNGVVRGVNRGVRMIREKRREDRYADNSRDTQDAGRDSNNNGDYYSYRCS